MTTAIDFDLPLAEYLDSPGLSNSALSTMARSMAHYHAIYLAEDRPPRKPPTPAMQAGSFAHTVALEPHRVAERYVVRPEWVDLRTKEGKAWAQSVSAGVQHVTAEQWDTAHSQRDAVLAVPELASLLAEGHSEVSAFWVDTATGSQCKCRPDHVHSLAGSKVILLDLKTAADVSPQGFAKSVWAFGYHRQAAFYSAGYEAASGHEVVAFIFAAVSSEYPFIAVAYMLDDAAMQMGYVQCASALAAEAECRKTGVWPAYGDGVQLLALPGWAKL